MLPLVIGLLLLQYRSVLRCGGCSAVVERAKSQPQLLRCTPNGVAGAPPLAKPMIDEAVAVLSALRAGPGRVAVAMLEDEFYPRQWERRIRMLARVRELLASDELAARVVPAGFLDSVVDAAGFVDDEDVREMFAQLVRSTVQHDAHAHPLFVELARRLSGADARRLRTVPLGGPPLALRRGAHTIDLTTAAEVRSLERMIGLGLLKHSGGQIGASMPLRMQKSPGSAIVEFTDLGWQFAEAVGIDLSESL